MKIVLVTSTITRGGVSTGANQLINSLKSVGHDVVVLSADEVPLFERFFRILERIFDRLIFGKAAHFFKFFPASIKYDAIVKEYDPDVIQLCNVSGNCFDFRGASGSHVPIVQRLSDFWPYHGPDHYALRPYSGLFSLRMFNFINGTIGFDAVSTVVAPSAWTANNVELPDSMSPNVVIVPNAVQENSSLEVGAKSIGDVVRLGIISARLNTPRKGVQNLTPFLRKLSRTMDIEVIVYGAGDPSFFEDVHFEYVGSFDRDSLANVYSSFDILLYPAFLENSPNTVTEALSFGVPVIAQCGTGTDFYVSNKVGRLIDFFDVDSTGEDFLTAVEDVVNDYELYSRGAIETVNQLFSYYSVGHAYTNIYDELIRDCKVGLYEK